MHVIQALHDQYRIQFYHAYLNNACQAIERYGLNVKKMFAWTFLDNFEWVSQDLGATFEHRQFKEPTGGSLTCS
jgi:beta-glucosidase/6-phospho-beta-glucosidase/beta-galactosidase